jgi:hypothetical protein
MSGIQVGASGLAVQNLGVFKDPRMPTGVLGETLPRFGTYWGSNPALTSGTLHLASIVLPAGTTVTNIGFYSAGAAVTPTHWWFSLYNSSGTLLSQTADQTSTAWGNNTPKVLALGAAQTTAYTGVYFLGICMAAATPVAMVTATATYYSVLSDGALGGAEYGWVKTNDTSLTDTAPASFGTRSYVGGYSGVYGWVT